MSGPTLALAIDSTKAAAGAAQFETAAKRVADAGNKAASQVAAANRRIGSAFALAATTVTAAVGSLTRSVVKFTDDYTGVLARLNNVSEGKAASGADVFNAIAAAAERARAPTLELAKIYTRQANALADLKFSQAESIRITETLSKITSLSGAASGEARAAMLQLSQALVSGKFSGDEFRSVAENLPEVMRILQRELGKTAGELRKMSREGKLTGETIAVALLNASKSVDEKFSKMPQTAGQAFDRFSDTFKRVVGEIGGAQGVQTAFVDLWNRMTAAVGSTEFKTAMESAAAGVAKLGQAFVTLIEAVSGAWSKAKGFFDWLADANDRGDDYLKRLLAAKPGDRVDPDPSVSTVVESLMGRDSGGVGTSVSAPFLNVVAPDRKRPVPIGEDENEKKKAERLRKRLEDESKIARERIQLAQAELTADENLIRAAKTDLEVRRAITDEMRKASPAGAAILEAQIRLTAELGRQKEVFERNAAIGERFANTLVDGISAAVTEGKNLGQTIKSVGLQMLDVINKTLILEPMIKKIGQAFAGGTGGTDLTTLFSGLIGSAFGGSAGGAATGWGATVVPAFASGGVVSRPTMAMIGEGGGPEAVLPLRRGANGQLGVAASGAGGSPVNVTINVAGDATESTVARMRQTAMEVFAGAAPGLVRQSVATVAAEHRANPGYLRR